MSSLQVKSKSPAKDLRSVIDEEMAAEIAAASEAKDLTKESAVRHKRHWVRLTRLCNQRCIFCLLHISCFR